MGTSIYPQLSNWETQSGCLTSTLEGCDRRSDHEPSNKQRQSAYVTSGVSIPLVTYVQAGGKKKTSSESRGCVEEREGGWKKKEKEILLHKEQV